MLQRGRLLLGLQLQRAANVLRTVRLIGTDLYKGFTVSSDCRCAKASSDQVLTGNSQINLSLSGTLDVPEGALASYTYIAPTSNSDAAISATVAGM